MISELLLAAFILSAQPSVSYTTDSAPNSSQWLVLQESSTVIAVAVNGANITQYPDITSLNQTLIGWTCDQVNPDGSCAEFSSSSDQGWVWDGDYSLLYVHYLGGPGVVVSIFDAAPSSPVIDSPPPSSGGQMSSLTLASSDSGGNGGIIQTAPPTASSGAGVALLVGLVAVCLATYYYRPKP